TFQGFDHAEYPDTVAVVALTEGAEIRVGGAAEAARHVGRNEVRRIWLHLVVFGAHHYGERKTRAARPMQRRAQRDRRRVVGRGVVGEIAGSHRQEPLYFSMRLS